MLKGKGKSFKNYEKVCLFRAVKRKAGRFVSVQPVL